eukprot:15028261-Heterocapsa_arctica.AAC.1
MLGVAQEGVREPGAHLLAVAVHEVGKHVRVDVAVAYCLQQRLHEADAVAEGRVELRPPNE